MMIDLGDQITSVTTTTTYQLNPNNKKVTPEDSDERW